MDRVLRFLHICVGCAILLAPHAVVAEPIWLFDGHSLDHWQTLSGTPVTRGWEIVDSQLHLAIGGERDGSIVTNREFGDFELVFEWRVAPGGNNGIKYRVQTFDGKTLGCEYQLIDDAGYHDRLRPNQTTAALYDVYEPTGDRFLQSGQRFNHGRIRVRNDHIQHWLNGQLVMCAHVGSPEWTRRIAASKFADVSGFGRNQTGRIMLTDHNDEVWFRYIVLLEYPHGPTGAHTCVYPGGHAARTFCGFRRKRCVLCCP